MVVVHASINLTKIISVNYNPLPEANSRLDGQEISKILWNRNFHYRAQNTRT